MSSYTLELAGQMLDMGILDNGELHFFLFSAYEKRIVNFEKKWYVIKRKYDKALNLLKANDGYIDKWDFRAES